MSADQLQQEIARAGQARQITEHPLWDEAWSALRDRCISQWETSEDEKVREEAWRMLHVARKVRRSFEQLITTGKLAERQIEESTNG